MRCFLPVLLVIFILLLISPTAIAATATFTNNVTLTETNNTYDGQDIVVDGATVAIDGPHSFNSVLLTNNAMLTHSPCTTTNTHKLDLMVTNAIVVSTNSRIDVSGKGYLTGRTSGNTTNGAATIAGGGSYGGNGGKGLGGINPGGEPGLVYGDYADPDDWGSGGGTHNGGVAGGGLMRMAATTLALDGQILANGSAFANTGGGAGGRVAVYGQDFGNLNTNAITAPGGLGNVNGGAGTVYLRDTDEGKGTLVIDAGSVGNGSTPLGLPGTNSVTFPDAVVIRGTGTQVRPEHAGMTIEFANTLTVINGARLEMENAVLGGATPLLLGTNSFITLSGSVCRTQSKVFFAYPSKPDISEVVRNAVVQINACQAVNIKTWEECKVGGKFAAR